MTGVLCTVCGAEVYLIELVWIHIRVCVYHLPINVYSQNYPIAQSVRVPV